MNDAYQGFPEGPAVNLTISVEIKTAPVPEGQLRRIVAARFDGDDAVIRACFEWDIPTMGLTAFVNEMLLRGHTITLAPKFVTGTVDDFGRVIGG